MTEFLPAFLRSQAVRAPLYLVWLAAIVLAIVRWSRHPRVSLATVLAITALWAVSLSVSFLDMWLPLDLRARGMSMVQLSRVYAAISIVNSILQAGCWGVLLFAIFGWRADLGTSRRELERS